MPSKRHDRHQLHQPWQAKLCSLTYTQTERFREKKLFSIKVEPISAEFIRNEFYNFEMLLLSEGLQRHIMGPTNAQLAWAVSIQIHIDSNDRGLSIYSPNLKNHQPLFFITVSLSKLHITQHSQNSPFFTKNGHKNFWFNKKLTVSFHLRLFRFHFGTASSRRENFCISSNALWKCTSTPSSLRSS